MGNNYAAGSAGIGQSRYGRPRILGLDGLRSLAIIGVTLFHMFPDTVAGGYLGVSLFFVLSGYLLAYNSENERTSGNFHILRYYLKRIKRIYPSLLVVILSTIGVYHFLAPKVIAAIRPEAFSVVLGYNNWWQIAQNADYFTRLTNASPFTHLWFMGIELQYYLIWPVLFLLYFWIADLFGRRAGLGFIMLLGLGTAVLMPMMYAPGQDVTRLYYGTDTRIYALLFGAAMGLCQASAAKRRNFKMSSGILKYCAFGLLLGLTIAGYKLMDGQSSLTYQGGMLFMTVIFCLLLALTADSQLLIGELLESPVFRWIGKRSYGIFLWQYPVIFLFQHMGWTEFFLYPLAELCCIVVLTIWSDDVSDCITKQRLPFREQKLVFIRGLLFLTITVTGLVFMGYGCTGIAASAEHKASDQGELQARLEKNAEEPARQNAAVSEKAAEQPSQPADAVKVDLNGAVCIGDSVMLGASGDLGQVLPNAYIDAEVSRYVGGGLEAAQAMEEQGRLGNLVVIALGTNGPIAGAERYEVQTRQLLEYLGPNRHIFWVNVYCPELKWQNTNNQYINKIAAEHSNVKVVDWYSLISQHPEWLVEDGIHPNNEGTAQYAKLIHDRMVQVLSEQGQVNPE